jgi:extradiol dioxygenase family protein
VSALCLFFKVDGDPVPVPHFGIALDVEAFHSLAKKLKDSGVQFIIEVSFCKIRF